MSTADRLAAERDREVQMVAKVYQDAVKRGVAPISAVMSLLGLSKPTAIRRIRAARDTGVLPEGSRPIYGSKLAAVAAALSIDPIRLQEAILEHAGGDLRVQPRGNERG